MANFGRGFRKGWESTFASAVESGSKSALEMLKEKKEGAEQKATAGRSLGALDEVVKNLGEDLTPEAGARFGRIMNGIRPLVESGDMSFEDAIEVGTSIDKAVKTADKIDKETVKVIGNSLIKYDPSTGEPVVLYTAPKDKIIKTIGINQIVEYDRDTGKLRKLTDRTGKILSTTEDVEGKPADEEKGKKPKEPSDWWLEEF